MEFGGMFAPGERPCTIQLNSLSERKHSFVRKDACSRGPVEVQRYGKPVTGVTR
jgi:hypothetical protein